MPLLVLLAGFVLAVAGIVAAAILEVLAELFSHASHDDRIPVRIERQRVPREVRPGDNPQLDEALERLLRALKM